MTIDLHYSSSIAVVAVANIRCEQPNHSTNKFLLNNQYVKSTIKEYSKNFLLRYFIFVTIPKTINAVQSVRNEAAHGETTSFKECIELRSKIVGIGESGVLCEFISFGMA